MKSLILSIFIIIINMDIINETSIDPEMIPVVDKKTAHLNQLGQARESAKIKRQREKETLTEMNTKLDTLLKKKGPVEKEEEEEEQDEPPPKRNKVRVTKTEEPEQGTESSIGDSLSVTALRSGAVLGLAGLSWYVQNVWKKQTTPVVENTKKNFPAVRVQETQKTQLVSGKNKVGKSGFVL
jgi:hypothetical protein